MVSNIKLILDTLIPEYAGDLPSQVIMLGLIFLMTFGLYKLIIKIWGYLSK